jgi:hypothetical protein
MNLKIFNYQQTSITEKAKISHHQINKPDKTCETAWHYRGQF